MTAKKSKYYVVWSGRKPGIYLTWADCSLQVNGYDKARYKAYDTQAEAEKAFAEGPPKGSSVKNEGQTKITGVYGPKPTNCIVVDAACAGNPGRMEYRGVLLPDNKVIFKQGPFDMGTNNIGEFLALVHAFAFKEKHNVKLPVFSDSKIGIAWYRDGKAKSKLVPTHRNTQIFELLARAELWLSAHPKREMPKLWVTDVWGDIPADYGRK